jgi:trimeric autotransporter adhesin
VRSLATPRGASNTASGAQTFQNNTTGFVNTASGAQALFANTTGSGNTASGEQALVSNTTGSFNTVVGFAANVSAGNLTNATAIGNQAIVDASNKIRRGNGAVMVIEGNVAPIFPSDKTKKENFQPVDGEEVLGKIRGFELSQVCRDPRHETRRSALRIRLRT